MPENQKKDTTYDLFDLFFQSQSLKKGGVPKKERVRDNSLDDGLEEIISDPVLYPVDTVMTDLFKEIDKSTQLFEQKDIEGENFPGGFSTKDFKYGFGLGSAIKFATNPLGSIQYSYSKYKQDRKWAGIGGFTNNTMNASLFSIMARRLGLTPKISRTVGASFLKPGMEQFDKDSKFLKQKFLEQFSDVVSEMVVQDLKIKYGEKDFDDKSIRSSISGIFSRFDSNQGININSIKTDLKSLTDKLGVSDKIWKDINELTFGSGDTKGLLETDPSRLYQNFRIASLNLLGIKASNNSPYKAKIIAAMLNDLAEGKDTTFGAKVGKAAFTFRWLKDGIVDKKFTEALLTGHYEDLRIGNFQLADVFDGDGNKTEEKVVVFAPNNTVMGKIFGSTYYMHPWNFIRGALLDGGFWLRFARQGGKIRNNSFYYFLYKYCPGQIARRSFSGISKVVNGVYSKIARVLLGAHWQFMIRQTVNKILTAIFGSTLPGVGLVISLLTTVISDEIIKIFSQVIIVIIVGSLAMVALVFTSFSGSSIGSQTYISYVDEYENNEYFQEEISGIEDKTYEDYLMDFENNGYFVRNFQKIDGKEYEDFVNEYENNPDVSDKAAVIEGYSFDDFVDEYENNPKFIEALSEIENKEYEDFVDEYENNEKINEAKEGKAYEGWKILNDMVDD